MLYRASVQDAKTGAVTRRRGHLAVVMQFYPRFLAKNLVDEYARALAPDKALFRHFKDQEGACGDHDAAFAQVDYENRFSLTVAGWNDLERLAGLSGSRDVFFICQCSLNQKCHADLLLLAARYFFHASIPLPRIKYPLFEARLPDWKS
jgi:hypothetical protein